MSTIDLLKQIDFNKEKNIYDILYYVNNKICKSKNVDDSQINIYILQKNIFTELFINSLLPLFSNGLKDVYEKIKKKCDNDKILYYFQEYLRDICNWDYEIKKNEHERFILHNKFKQKISIMYNIIVNLNLFLLLNPQKKFQKNMI